MDPDKLATAYVSGRAEDFWAWEEVQRGVRADLHEGWRLILLLLERVKDSDIEYVAAGPLEDLVDIYGHKALDLAEAELPNNPRLQRALGSIAVLFYYEEFDRWYGLLLRYGLRSHRVADASVIGKVLGVIKAYLAEEIGVYDYGSSVTGLLNEPFEDKVAQKILQRVALDVELMDSKQPPDGQGLSRAQLQARAGQAVTELEELGYRSTHAD